MFDMQEFSVVSAHGPTLPMHWEVLEHLHPHALLISVYNLIQTPIVGWCMEGCESRNKHQWDMC